MVAKHFLGGAEKCHTGKTDPTLSVETNDADQCDENTETTPPRHRLRPTATLPQPWRPDGRRCGNQRVQADDPAGGGGVGCHIDRSASGSQYGTPSP
ncbi:hypothetical protein GCM10010276_79060 [Streptomyces longisporus]|uniref:Uncharacterized protein n=1 Tax=Streptomyces longisporus TaxID=1948 RepID=A0ABP6AKL3_STRLO